MRAGYSETCFSRKVSADRGLCSTANYALSLDLDAYLFNFFVMIGHTQLYDTAANAGQFRFCSVLEYNDVVNTDHLDVNFSDIPYKDLATVKAVFDLLTVTRKKKTAEKRSAGTQFLKKAVNSAAEYLSSSPLGLFSVFRRGFTVFYYPLAHPGILKKYGLTKK